MFKYLGFFIIALSVGASDNNNNNNNNFVSDNNNAFRIIRNLNSLPEASALIPVATQRDGMMVLACLKNWFCDMANREPLKPEALPSEILNYFEEGIDNHVKKFIENRIESQLHGNNWKLQRPFSFYTGLVRGHYGQLDKVYNESRKTKNVAISWQEVDKEFSHMYMGALEKFNQDLIDRLNNPLKSE